MLATGSVASQRLAESGSAVDSTPGRRLAVPGLSTASLNVIAPAAGKAGITLRSAAGAHNSDPDRRRSCDTSRTSHSSVRDCGRNARARVLLFRFLNKDIQSFTQLLNGQHDPPSIARMEVWIATALTHTLIDKYSKTTSNNPERRQVV